MSLIIVWDSFVFSCLFLVIASLVTDYRAIFYGTIFQLFYYMVFAVVNLFFRIILKFIKLPIYLVIFLVCILTTIYMSSVIAGTSTSIQVNDFTSYSVYFENFLALHSFFIFGFTISLFKNCTKYQKLNKFRFNFKKKINFWRKIKKN